MYNARKVPWVYKPPINSKECKEYKLFDLSKPYSGPRLNLAQIEMPVKPDKSYGSSLKALTKPLPESFSWRGDVKRIEQGVRDQGLCGSCWSFAVSSVLGDRYSIKYNIESCYPSTAWLLINGKPPNVPSVLECDTGGNTFTGAKWIEKYGTRLEQCYPYTLIRNSLNWTCPESFYRNENGKYILKQQYKDCCYGCCNAEKIKDKSVFLSIKPNSTKYIVVVDNSNNIDTFQTTQAIQREILENGPVVVAFKVYEDFMQYWKKLKPGDTKIYMPNSNAKSQGNHAVVLTGWGVGKHPFDPKKQIRYWEMRNSWGESGDKGFCRFAFSLDTPSQFWRCIDIPEKYNNQWLGGCVVFTPGDLPNSPIFQKLPSMQLNISNNTATTSSNNSFLSDNIVYIIIGIINIIIVIAMVIYFQRNLPKTVTQIPVIKSEPSVLSPIVVTPPPKPIVITPPPKPIVVTPPPKTIVVTPPPKTSTANPSVVSPPKLLVTTPQKPLTQSQIQNKKIIMQLPKTHISEYKKGTIVY